MSDTEQIDKLFLELSQFTKATTAKELSQQAEITRLNAIIAGMQKVDDLLAPQWWISVDDRLPDVDVFVDVIISSRENEDYKVRKTDRLYQVDGGFMYINLYGYEYVSHWKPLPPKP